MGNPDFTEAVSGIMNHETDFRLDLDANAEQWWSALLTLDQDGDGISIDDFLALLPAAVVANLIVPVAYTLSDRAIKYSRNFVSVIALKSTLDALNEIGAYPVLSNIDLGTHIDTQHIDFDAQPQHDPAAKIEVSDDTVIMAIIDDGIAIAHDLFRDTQTSTRILHADLFAVVPDPIAQNATYGRRLNKAGIDALLNQFQVDGILDEAAFYAATGQVNYANSTFDPLSQIRSHGTHVTALAAGYPIDKTVPNRPIMCAAIPAAVTQDITGQSLLPSLALALQSLSKAARQYQLSGSPELAPVVLNFSYGNTSGPHDGTDETSELLEWYGNLVPNRKLWMTLPAGNVNLGQGHAVMPLGSASEVTMVVLPDDRTASHVELWLPFGFDTTNIDQTQITITTPTGEVCAFVPTSPGEGANILDRLGRKIARISYQFLPQPTERGMVLLSINPTFSLLSDVEIAPSGRWTIESKMITNCGADDGDLTVWIRRDERQPGYNTGGRQSYFIDPLYKRFGEYGEPLAVDPTPDPSLIRRAGTLSGFACGQTPIVVASLTQSTNEASDYSSSGSPTITPNSPSNPARTAPDVTALGDDSLVLDGVISAGTNSGSFVRMNGTSVAAPRLARFAANHIASSDVPAREFIYRYLGSPGPYNPRTGAGTVEIPVPWRTA